MKAKISKKYLILINRKLGKNYRVFKFCEIKNNPYIKGLYCNKVYKKGYHISKNIVVKNNRKTGEKYVDKISRTTNNQLSIILDHKEQTNSRITNVLFLKKSKNKIVEFVYLILIGLVIGFINGFWGGGGGMVCVPTLTMLLGLPDKKAHATAIFIMLPLSIVSFIVYSIKSTVDFGLAGIIAGGFTLGGVLGALLLKKINNNLLQIIFALVIMAGAIKILI